MKRNTLIGAFPVFCFAAILFASCKKKEPTPYTNYGHLYFTASLNGSQLVPTVNSTGVGYFQGVYDANSQILNIKCSWSNMLDSLNKFQIFAPADSGQVVPSTYASLRDFTGSLRGKTDSVVAVVFGANPFSATELAYLKSGKCYVVFCSRAFSKGEIRGQVRLEKIIY